jgi:hypothetical protein
MKILSAIEEISKYVGVALVVTEFLSRVVRIIMSAAFFTAVLVEFFIASVLWVALDHALLASSPITDVIVYIGVVWFGVIEWHIGMAFVAGISAVIVMVLSKGHPRTIFKSLRDK